MIKIKLYVYYPLIDNYLLCYNNYDYLLNILYKIK